MSSPYYDKVDIDLKFDQHRKYLEDIAKNMAKGVAAIIYPETSTQDINALSEDFMYSLGKAGTYKFTPSFVIIEGQEPNVLPLGFDVIVTKKNGVWRTVSALALPKYDDTSIQAKIKALETAVPNKVDKVTGKGLSTNDFDNTSKFKVNMLENTGNGKMFLANDGTYKKAGSGSGSGFYNVTQKYPKSNGRYYNLDEAIQVLSSDLDLEQNTIIGMILTFESSSGVWEDYRFIGEELSELPVVSNWVVQGARDAVKKVTLMTGVDTSVLSPDGDGNLFLEVPTVEVDETLSADGTNPVQGKAIYTAIEANSDSVAASAVLNEHDDDVKSLSLLNAKGDVISTTSTWASGGGGGTGPTTNTKVVLTKLTENPTVKLGDEVKLNFLYDQIDSTSGASTGIGATATITVSRGATSTSFTQDLVAGSTTSINVTQYLTVGTSNVRVRVVTNDDLAQVATIAWAIQVVQLRLESAFNIATETRRGSNIIVPYSLSGTGNKTVEIYVDGVKKDDKLISTSSSAGSFTVSTTQLAHGSHSIQLRTKLELPSGDTILSNSIYFDAIVIENNVFTPLVATRFDYNDGRIIPAGQRPTLVTKQFEDYRIVYAGYNPRSNQNNIRVTVNGETISSITTAFIQRSVVGQAAEAANMPASITIKDKTYDFTVEVVKSDVNLEEPTDNLVFKLSAKGRTNADENRTEWSNKGITTKLTGIQYEGDGWQDNALRLMNGGKAVINYAPLSADNMVTQNAFAFQTKIKVSKVTNPDLPLISCVTGDVGFTITPEEVKWITGGKSEVSMKFSAGQEYNIALVSMPTVNGNSSEYERINDSMVYLYINGILSGGVQRGTGDNIYQSGNSALITIGNDSAILDVYNTRCYNNYLTHDQVLNIFMLDLSTVEEVVTKFKANEVIDQEGNVTIDSLQDGSRYVILTGEQANGMPTAKYAAAINNKDIRYDLTEILHIKKGKDKSLNMKCVGGCLRLQGTSSLAYPIKNYRFYFRSANNSKVFGEVYTGVDEFGAGGTKIEDAKPLWSFKPVNSLGKIPAPVNVWCLKADYAESSSSHNTGMARMANDALVQTASPTPAQKYSTSPYDVRTTVDGEPCYVFYRNTVTDKPTFLGKFNLNNDKSTESVFGFTDVKGYHDQPWVDTEFGGNNPTECWEFLNNDFPMGKYLDDDFDTIGENGKPEWTKVFESRFPDNQKDYDSGSLGKPKLLSTWVSWVKSTKDNPTKFKNELANYADVTHLCKYFVFTQIMGAVDQMVKNAMLGFWYAPDKARMLAYYIFYDNDTILGVRNDGRLKYDWELNRQTLDPELTASAGTPIYAYMGHDSVLWNNLETQFKDEIRDAYRSLRSYLTTDRLFNYFNRDQSEKFAERIYNLDAQHKYIEPKTLGVDIISNGTVVNTKYSYLESMQGSRQSHRKWWLENRLDLFDARYGTGEYTLTDITWKGISDAGAKVSAVLTKDYYIELRRESTTMTSDFVEKDTEWSYTYDQVANVGTIFHLFGGKFFKKLDMSMWGGFTDLTFPNLENLEDLVLGHTSRRYGLSELVVGSKFPLLSKIDITNYFNLPSLNLSACTSLKEIIAVGCDRLGTINLPAGSQLEKMTLPNALQTLKLEGLGNLTNENILFPEGNTVSNLSVSACPLIDWEALFDTLGNVKNIRITDINKTGSADFLDKFKNLGGLDSLGNTVSTPRLSGTYRLTRYLDDVTFENYRSTFPELLIVQPEYSVIEFDDAVNDPKNVSNLDNNTGYKFGNTYVPSGHSKVILNRRFACLGKQATEGVMSITKLSDADFNKYADDTTADIITGGSGDVFIYEPGYWKKGVNDKKNEKKYHLYSTNSTKPGPEDKNAITHVINVESFLTPKAIAEAPVELKYYKDKVVTLAQTIEESLVTSLNYNSYGVKIKGFKQIRFPTELSSVVSSRETITMVTNSEGNFLKSVIIPSTDLVFVNGMYYVLDVPEGAEWVYFTLNNSIPFEKVVLTTSTSIFDIETEWVKVEPFLMGAYETTLNSMAIYQSTAKPSIPITSMTFDAAQSNALSRKLILQTYEMRCHVSNLFLAKYGTRDSQLQCAYGSTDYNKIIGITSITGMNDTVNPENKTYDAWYEKIVDGKITYVKIKNTKFMGYENYYGNDYEQLGGIIRKNYERLEIKMNNGESRELRCTTSMDGYITSVVNGAHMDIIPARVTGASSSTRYCDNCSINLWDNKYFTVSSLSQGGYGGAFYIGTSTGASSQVITCRLGFIGNITVVSRSEFDNIKTFF